ncbi:unknown protein [Cronobacter turicensis z3032]|uniref:Uncharacterized protein n=1 Tax=Cronobacter turicensis (strain DSM 18703 / CCUG 55852 / LMG 23827 / z3032) TaxID=693216 RepID=C9XTY4_CROTZ|nr:unknown protein [Cronobacter turicensis z3032]
MDGYRPARPKLKIYPKIYLFQYEDNPSLPEECFFITYT